MTGETSSPKRLTTMAWRASVLIGCALLAWLTFTSAIAHIARGSNPEAALKFVPNDAVALSGKAEGALAATSSSALVSKDTKNLVLASLRSQALNARALRQLGFIADANNQTASAKRLIKLSERASRREFGAQLWLIENGVRSDNIQATLVHYDIALRSGYDSGGILFPILTAALDDREVQTAFARYVKNPPPWLGLFLSYAIGQGQNPSAIATAVSVAGGLPKGDVFRDFERQLLAQLVVKERYAEARQYYLSLAGVDPNVPVSIGFGKMVTNPRFAPISWEVQNTPGVGAAFEGGENGDGQRLSIFAGSGERGAVLRKLLFLAAGRYAITQEIKLQRLGGDATATWEIKCLRVGEQRVMWRGSFSPVVGRKTLPPFDIAADCTMQSIALVVSGGSNQDGSEVILTGVALVPIKQ
jgi:hypothetical protein